MARMTRWLKFRYEFAVLGGAIGTYEMQAFDGPVPANAALVGAIFNAYTPFDDGGSGDARVDIGLVSSAPGEGDILNNAPLNQTPFAYGQYSGTHITNDTIFNGGGALFTSAIPPNPSSSPLIPNFTISGHDLTAGAIDLWLEILQLD